MRTYAKTLVVILCEAALEPMLIADSRRLGAQGYTVVDARGGGRRGVREANWEADRSIRMEIVCDTETAEAIIDHVRQQYFENYAMILYTVDIGVVRPDKF